MHFFLQILPVIVRISPLVLVLDRQIVFVPFPPLKKNTPFTRVAMPVLPERVPMVILPLE
jgi:hypothetical protein